MLMHTRVLIIIMLYDIVLFHQNYNIIKILVQIDSGDYYYNQGLIKPRIITQPILLRFFTG